MSFLWIFCSRKKRFFFLWKCGSYAEFFFFLSIFFYATGVDTEYVRGDVVLEEGQATRFREYVLRVNKYGSVVGGSQR